MRLGSRETTGWRATVSVAMSNYIEAGSIIAIAVSLSLWQEEFGVDDFAVGLLAALSANAFGAAAGALVGGWLCDRYGRKFIYTYDLLVYMAGVLLAVFAFSYGMLLMALVITGLAVGAGFRPRGRSSPRRRPPTGAPVTWERRSWPGRSGRWWGSRWRSRSSRWACWAAG